MRYNKTKAFATIVLPLAAFLLFTADARAVNIVANPGFETGVLGPWFQDRNFCTSPCENWNVTGVDKHSGNFSATDVGNIEIRQNFSATPDSTITQVAFWTKHPDGGTVPEFVDLFFSDGTDTGFSISTTTNNWEFEDVTSHLAVGKNLTGFSIFGFSGGTGTQRTFLDDVVINAGASVIPEPQSLLLLITGLFGLIAFSRRRQPRAAY